VRAIAVSAARSTPRRLHQCGRQRDGRLPGGLGHERRDAQLAADLPLSPNGGTVTALQIVGSTMYVGVVATGGSGTQCAGLSVSADLTRVSRARWSSPMVTPRVDLFAALDGNGDLYAGGSFLNWGTIASATTWSSTTCQQRDEPVSGASPQRGRSTPCDDRTDLYVGLTPERQRISECRLGRQVERLQLSALARTPATPTATSEGSPSIRRQALTTSGSTVYASETDSTRTRSPLR